MSPVAGQNDDKFAAGSRPWGFISSSSCAVEFPPPLAPPRPLKLKVGLGAVLSLAVVTRTRVTVWHSLVWGWDMTPANVITVVGPRTATPNEVAGHLNLLRKGVGTGPVTFGKLGWTFRAAP